MNPESLVFFNLQIYVLGFILFMILSRTVFARTAGVISLVINILGLISTSNFLVNTVGTISLHYEWISLEESSISFTLLISPQTRFMLFLVQIISGFVNLFSLKYMAKEPGVSRFFAYLNLFIFSMLGLVLAGNMLQLYFFWELVGFCSYLLIGFWYTKPSANAAAIKAFLLNRLGDASLLLGALLIYYLYGTFRFDDFAHGEIIVREYWYLDGGQWQTVAMVLIFGGVMAKSAQLPLQVWLADAMEGPTPASALIHAATMVVAGVFLLGRISVLITPDAGLWISSVGAATSVFAALSALFQNDLKKVLAFSTVSQLGFMVTGMGMGEVAASLFHLTTHAFFKAGLFLCAGAIISYMHHEQDMRKMGTLIKALPAVFGSFLACSAALVGLPLTGGYLSKESILNAAWVYGLNGSILHLMVPVLLTITAFITTLYTVRMVVMVFFQREDSPVDILLDTTKKTVDGALKSFKDLLTGDNKGSGEEKVIQLVRSLGIYDIVTLGLGISALWFFYSPSPVHLHEVWFFQEFGGVKEIYDWLPWLVGFLFLAGLLISYNQTLEEIRRFYFKTPAPAWRVSFALLAINQFGMSRMYENLFSAFMRSPILRMIQKIEVKGIDAAVMKLGKSSVYFAQWAGYIEKKYIDAAVMGSFQAVKKLGNWMRTQGQGNVQRYLLIWVISLVAILVLLILL